MKKILPVLIGVLASCLTAVADPSPSPSAAHKLECVALDPLLAQENPWELPAESFVTDHKEADFRWVSNARDAADSSRPGLSLFKLSVYQAIARFSGGKLHELCFSFYNRGDAGELPRDQFEALLKQAANAVTDFTKLKFTERGKDSASAVKAFGLVWQTAQSQFLLEYSFTKSPAAFYRAEFIRLTVLPVEKPKGLLEASLAASRGAEKFNGPSHLKNSADGDVFIEGIPMVDQGEKGYCVVASAERVIRYYGGKADEHELAQIANSSAESGTSVTAMLDSLKKLSNRLRIKIRTVESFDTQHFLALVKEYNRAAQHGKQADPVDLNGAHATLSDVYQQMDGKILRESRTKNPGEMNRFFRGVQTHINQGIPLLWSVMIGVLPQPKDPKGYGGHMRLIIGYNAKTNEIIYSDSWGLGHEMKRMPLADAWTITNSLNTIEPL